MKRKVRPPRPAARRMTYPVIGPNQVAVPTHLYKENGCNLQNYKEFQQFFWSRRLSSPWNLRNLEKDWAEATRKGVATPALEKVYLESKEKLVLKEKKEADPAPVAAAA